MEQASIHPADPRMKLPRVAIIAAIIAFLLVFSALVSALQHPWYLIVALVPAMAGITILRKHVWGAYGFALFEITQSTVTPALLLRNSSVPVSQIGVLIAFGLILSAVFFFAGRSLTAAGAKRGSPLPWIAVALLFTLPFVFVRAYVMPSGSMENTLLIGDHILVRVFPRPVPARGDLVVFRYPLDRQQILVKRIIGSPGDRVRMQSRIVYVNGTALTEPYVIHTFPPDTIRDNLPGNSSSAPFSPGSAERTEMLNSHVANGEIVVPSRKYLVLGDNRDNSLDSRYWGFLDASDIIGKPIMIYESETPAETGAPSPSPTKTRWERLFKLL